MFLLFSTFFRTDCRIRHQRSWKSATQSQRPSILSIVYFRWDHLLVLRPKKQTTVNIIWNSRLNSLNVQPSRSMFFLFAQMPGAHQDFQWQQWNQICQYSTHPRTTRCMSNQMKGRRKKTGTVIASIFRRRFRRKIKSQNHQWIQTNLSKDEFTKEF